MTTSRTTPADLATFNEGIAESRVRSAFAVLTRDVAAVLTFTASLAAPQWMPGSTPGMHAMHAVFESVSGLLRAVAADASVSEISELVGALNRRRFGLERAVTQSPDRRALSSVLSDLELSVAGYIAARAAYTAQVDADRAGR